MPGYICVGDELEGWKDETLELKGWKDRRLEGQKAGRWTNGWTEVQMQSDEPASRPSAN
jgi:hypothetical protein